MSEPAAVGAALDLRRPLRPAPTPSLRPWAGRRLGAGVGELWLAGPGSSVTTSAGEMVTLDDLARVHRERLVGSAGIALLGPRFPLLVKLIDAAAWLSLQVHPSDAVAGELEGPGHLGKTEAWVVVDADPGAELITGPRPGLARSAVRSAIADGTLDRPDCDLTAARVGDAYLIRAGTIHAIGPGLLVYEIEQPSDLTYRISDWGRPSTPERPLHTRQALRAVVPDARAVPAGQGFVLDGGALRTRELRLAVVTGDRVERRPAGRSAEIVSALGGRVVAAGDGWREVLEPTQTLVIPAAVSAYALAVEPPAMAFVGDVP